MSTPNILKFTQFNSAVDAAFWQSFVSKKLDELKLSDEPLPIQGYFTQRNPTALDEHGDVVLIPTRFHIPSYGIETDATANKNKAGHFTCTGTLVHTNTMEEFRALDKNRLFQHTTEKIKLAVESGDALKDNSLLNTFLMLMFADLKSNKFYYWCAFPAIMPQPEPWTISSLQRDYFPENRLNEIDEAYQTLTVPSPYFWIKQEKTGKLQVAPLCEFDHFYQNNRDDCLLGFLDPSTSPDTPAWPLRNVLYLVQKTWQLNRLKVLCHRSQQPQQQQQQQQQQISSFVINIELPNASNYQDVKAVGWERNVQGKLGPRLADLGPLMDPIRLAEQYGDLNLRLMRWRLMPDLDLEKIKQTKCLLFGAGTLGCYVARSLLAWGVRQITFVDNGKVSLSNPVRQPLYSFQDAVGGKHYKAETAARSLKEIHPTVVSNGYHLEIPMPGHPTTEDEQLQKQMTKITELIEEHDVIFLLTDSRESRWYPTLIASKFNKITINSALGFDTYLVMRHGSRTQHQRQQPQQQQNLGCYFCNDVVAPADSLADRTLDQQCTVTRPGLSAIAAGLSVELMVSVLQHPDGIEARADTSSNLSDPLPASSTSNSSLLGVLPHQIRGFLGQFRNLLIVGQAYENCTACSEKVLKAYEKNPFDFMKKVLQDSVYLEEVTGLLKMKQDSEVLFKDWDNVEDEDDF